LRGAEKKDPGSRKAAERARVANMRVRFIYV
jgi:hypothetical protein